MSLSLGLKTTPSKHFNRQFFLHGDSRFISAFNIGYQREGLSDSNGDEEIELRSVVASNQTKHITDEAFGR